MYTRSIDPMGADLRIPSNYDGSLLGGLGGTDDGGVHTTDTPTSGIPSCQGERKPPFSFFDGLFKNGRFSLQSIEFEDLLIIGIGLYLLFSREGDKECGILLLLLLFVT